MKNALKTILLVSMLGLLACGEAKTPRELELARKREQMNQRLSELQPIVGEYEGEMYLSDSAQSGRFHLNVVLAGKSYDSANSPDEITAPTVSATALVYGTGRDSDTYVYFNFDHSDYDANSKQLVFYSDNPSGSLVVHVGADGALSGTWMLSSKGVAGQFRANRVKGGGIL